MSKKKNKKDIIAAKNELWRRGVLEWKLDPFQKRLYKQYHESPEKILTWVLSRRSGKSFTLCILALEECIRKPNRIVKYVTPQLKMVRQYIKPLLREILEDAPPDVTPEFKTMDNNYVFPNGSEIQLAGSDSGNAEKLRGGNSYLNIVDEAGFCDKLENLVGSVLMPTTTLTGAKIILSSTPPEVYEHDFVDYMDRAEMDGTLVKADINYIIETLEKEGNRRLTHEIIDEIAAGYPGGRQNSQFLREYMCILKPDESLQIVPEFTQELQEDIVIDWPRPKFYHTYISMDPGFKDLTGVLFAYYDYQNAVVVIEDEIVINGPTMTTELLAEKIKTKEEELWRNPLTNEINEPVMRVSDVNPILLNDLQRLHNLTFFATPKDNLEAALNQMRMKLQNRQIYINPRCKNLIQHLKNGTWKSNRKEFKRSPVYGHYDLVAALIYLIRNIDYHRNPYPAGIKVNFDTFVSPNYQPSTPHDEWKKIFKRNK